MSIATIDLATARDAADAILKELQLDAYIFEVEPQDDTWILTVECACKVDGAWETIRLQVPKQMLLGSFDNAQARDQLFEYWKKKLAGCKLQQT